MMYSNDAHPFLKWAGGKGQLLEQMIPYFPAELKAGRLRRYVEPFVGAGAVFFYVAQHYEVEHFYLSDVNEELVRTYVAIRDDVDGVVSELARLAEDYVRLDPRDRAGFYYEQRAIFNRSGQQPVGDSGQVAAWRSKRAAAMLFLNRTCFNGLFRVNSRGYFNVPFGDYANPTILDECNLRKVSALLKQGVTIRQADFTDCEDCVSPDSFVYFDPPYRPISVTASFTSYARGDFTDEDQRRLARLFRRLDSLGAKVMLSNSDPKNVDPADDFFDNLYAGFSIGRLSATRMINCVAARRGPVAELLVTNYSPLPALLAPVAHPMPRELVSV